MAQKIQHCTIILPDSLYSEILEITSQLSEFDGNTWSVSRTVSLLVEYCYRTNPKDDRFDSFLDSYLYGKQFLKEFRMAVEISAVLE